MMTSAPAPAKVVPKPVGPLFLLLSALVLVLLVPLPSRLHLRSARSPLMWHLLPALLWRELAPPQLHLLLPLLPLQLLLLPLLLLPLLRLPLLRLQADAGQLARAAPRSATSQQSALLPLLLLHPLPRAVQVAVWW